MIIKKTKNQYLKNQEGSAIFLVVLVLTGILVAVLGINSLVIKGIKLSRNIAWSAPSYFAAETGMERALYYVRKKNMGFIPDPKDENNPINGNFDLKNNEQNAKWEVTFKCIDYDDAKPELRDCASEEIDKMSHNTMLIIKSIGTFKSVNRSIELSFCLKKKTCR